MYSLTDSPNKAGLWSTPALGDGVIYAVTHKGTLIVVDQETGEELWYYTLGFGSWSSPAIVDNQPIVAANDGLLRRFDLSDPRDPQPGLDLQGRNRQCRSDPGRVEGHDLRRQPRRVHVCDR